MPLTFAHPAAVLPFCRKRRNINFFAMVLGSMAPDFEYFLRGQPIGEIGHTFTGFFLFNLPLVVMFYFIYHQIIHLNIVHHLPNFLQVPSSYKVEGSKKWKTIVFCYSALFGMLTHVVWDSFTHKHGFMVVNFPILTHTFNVNGYQIPIYKFLQHGSTLLGISLIIGYMYYRASQNKNKNTPKIGAKKKLYFWALIFILTLLYVCLWCMIDRVSISSYGIMVVRIIDSFFGSLLTISLVITYHQNNSDYRNNKLQ
ncbi:DUF4184 family protein [Lysinibacillus xylanilyticus]|uniref:DUF4184 family protein n=1 Tax=Lysinibacillus xylanilyticus TaxID=582475 RepID=UPI002B24EE45|nr:DUF4184 family protein [Lysinibacillus xylanilyticus]MEB2301705.1 DUF4184 family protein [Lysinibacillus xylanilyticus]